MSEPRRAKACGGLCGISTGIHEGLTFGRGDLDEHGFWEVPCEPCARAHEESNPGCDPCWPFTSDDDADRAWPADDALSHSASTAGGGE